MREICQYFAKISICHSPARPGNPCARERVRSKRWKSSFGECSSPIAEGNCVAVKRGGEQPEA
ncbi:MAG: hypothetical protein ABFD50_14260, partial [Smithella sp.]